MFRFCCTAADISRCNRAHANQMIIFHCVCWRRSGENLCAHRNKRIENQMVCLDVWRPLTVLICVFSTSHKFTIHFLIHPHKKRNENTTDAFSKRKIDVKRHQALNASIWKILLHLNAVLNCQRLGAKDFSLLFLLSFYFWWKFLLYYVSDERNFTDNN